MKSLRFITTFLIIFVLFSIIVWSAEAKKDKKVTGDTNFSKRELHERSDTNLPSRREPSDEEFDVEFLKRSEDGGFHEVDNNNLKRNNLSKRALIYRGGTYSRYRCGRLCRGYRYYAYCNSSTSYCVCFNRLKSE